MKFVSAFKGGIAHLKDTASTKIALSSIAVSSTIMALSVSAFAADPLPTVTITPDMLKPVVEGAVSTISAIFPIGLGLFAIIFCAKMVPGFLRSFIHG